LPQILLKRLLETQLEIQKDVPDVILISTDELHEIRRLWRTEQHDWRDQVPQIYYDVTGRSLDWVQEDMGSYTVEDQIILDKICKKNNVPLNLVAKLLDLERKFNGMSRRVNIYKRIDKILKKDWRSLEDIMKS